MQRSRSAGVCFRGLVALVCGIFCGLGSTSVVRAQPRVADPVLEQSESFELAPLRFGVVGGFNITDLSGTADVNVAGMALEPSLVGSEGGTIGGFVAVKLRPRVALRIEAVLEQRGAAASGSVPVMDGQSAPYSFDYSFLYVAVPVVAEWHIAYDGVISPFVFGGVTLAVNLDADVSGQALVADAGGNPMLVTDSEDIPNAARFDVGGIVGIGVRYPLGRRALRVDLRLSHSVTKVLDGYETRPQQGLSLTGRALRTRALSAVLSYEL